MADLVSPYRLDLRGRTAAKKLSFSAMRVVPRKPETLALMRLDWRDASTWKTCCVGDAVGARERQNAFLSGPSAIGLYVLNIGAMKTGPDHDAENDERACDRSRQKPPVARGARGWPRRSAASQDPNCTMMPRPLPYQAANRACSFREAIGVLAIEALVERHRKDEHRENDSEQRGIDALEPTPRHEALGEIAHAGRGAGEQEHKARGDGDERVPQDQPVAALEIGVGFSLASPLTVAR